VLLSNEKRTTKNLKRETVRLRQGFTELQEGAFPKERKRKQDFRIPVTGL
jgi:hypothetical protein